jgi:hypothetical protein
MAEGSKTETVDSLVRLRARFEAWSMGWRDSDLGDTPASVIPFERVFVLINPCLRRPPLIHHGRGGDEAQPAARA